MKLTFWNIKTIEGMVGFSIYMVITDFLSRIEDFTWLGLAGKLFGSIIAGLLVTDGLKYILKEKFEKNRMKFRWWKEALGLVLGVVLYLTFAELFLQAGIIWKNFVLCAIVAFVAGAIAGRIFEWLYKREISCTEKQEYAKLKNSDPLNK